MKKTVVVIRPAIANIQINEYFTWIKNVLRWQGKFDINIVVLDMPDLLRHKQKTLLNNYIGITRDLFSLGIDPDKVNIVFQSQLPKIQEMTSYFQYIQLVNKSSDDELKKTTNSICIDDESFATCLETAIVMIFSGDIVLIDKHEIKKVEAMRDLISKFNLNFGGKLKLPQSFVSCNPGLIGLDGKEKFDNKNYLFFSDDLSTLKKKIVAAVTDSGSVIKFDIKKKPYISNLINLYQLLTDKTYDEIENEFLDKKYFEFKNTLLEKLDDFLKLNFIKPSAINNQNIKRLLLKSNKKTEKKLKRNLEIFKKIARFPKF